MLETDRSSLLVRSIQRKRKVNTRLLRWMTRFLLQDLLHRDHYDLCVTLVNDQKMTQLNEEHLQHAGTTDVITFDYNDPQHPERIAGEIFISVEEAERQAKKYRTVWSNEVARYVVHGVLHLAGYNDLEPADRRVMKREEDRLLKAVDARFRTAKLAGANAPKTAARPLQ